MGQKEYLNNREKELWDIIGLQRTAITTLGTENRDYNRKVYERSKELESITMLDDIKIMKKNLKKEHIPPPQHSHSVQAVQKYAYSQTY